MKVTEFDWQRERSLLVIAHPGHELRVHHWLASARPWVLVLTDGSGHIGRSRLAQTSNILGSAGARGGPVYGRYTDAELYRLILQRDVDAFARLVQDIVGTILSEDIAYVAGDAIEGFNPGHDLCRYAINAAIAWVENRHGLMVRNYDFVLDGPPDACSPELAARAIRLELPGDALERKLAAMAHYPELRADVDLLVAKHGKRFFQIETLRPASRHEGVYRLPTEPPEYERYGSERIKAGYYREVIRYRAHVQPLVLALWNQLCLSSPVEGTL